MRRRRQGGRRGAEEITDDELGRRRVLDVAAAIGAAGTLDLQIEGEDS